jgi:hypothetical protein
LVDVLAITGWGLDNARSSKPSSIILKSHLFSYTVGCYKHSRSVLRVFEINKAIR